MHNFMIQPGKFENADKPEARYFILVTNHQPGSAILFWLGVTTGDCRLRGRRRHGVWRFFSGTGRGSMIDSRAGGG